MSAHIITCSTPTWSPTERRRHPSPITSRRFLSWPGFLHPPSQGKSPPSVLQKQGLAWGCHHSRLHAQCCFLKYPSSTHTSEPTVPTAAPCCLPRQGPHWAALDTRQNETQPWACSPQARQWTDMGSQTAVTLGASEGLSDFSARYGGTRL